MKILQATTAIGWSGGTEQCFLLAKYMNKKGIKTDILTYPNCELDRRAQKESIQTIYFPNKKKFSITESKKLAKLIENYDIINTHISKAHWFVWLSSFFTNKRPKIVYTRRVPYGLSPLSLITKYNLHTDAIIGVSKQIIENLKKNPLIKHKLRYIPSGVEINRFSPNIKTQVKQELKIPADAIVLTNVGNFSEIKGHHILLPSFKKLLESGKIKRPTYLLLAGRDTTSPQAKELIQKLKLTDRVIPLGFRRDIPEILKATDIFVFPSLNEGIAGSLLQAMAMKKTVVASYVGGIKTYLKHMENGIAVEPGSVESLYKGLLTAIENINNEKMKENARKTALNFDIEKVVDKTLKVYEEVLNGIS